MRRKKSPKLRRKKSPKKEVRFMGRASATSREPWLFEPLQGLGPIRLGSSRESLKSVRLGTKQESDAQLSFFEGRLRISLSAEGAIEYIGFAPDLDQQVVYRRQVLNGLAWEEFVLAMAPAVFRVPDDDPSTTICEDLSVALWRRFDPADLEQEIQELEAKGGDPDDVSSLREDALAAGYPDEIALAVAGYWSPGS